MEVTSPRYSSKMDSKYRYLLLPLLIVIPFSGILNNGFVWLEPYEVLRGDLIARNWSEVPDKILYANPNISAYYRPLSHFLFSLEWHLWGDNPQGYHLFNLLLHGLNSLLAFWLFRSLSQSSSQAFFAALLWGLHPVIGSVVPLIQDKPTLLVSFFSLGFLNCIHSLALANTPRVSKAQILATLLLFVAAIFTKELGLVLPLIAGLLLVFRFKQAWLFQYLGLLLVISVLFLIINFGVYSSNNSTELGHTLTDRILTSIPVYVRYVIFSIPGIETNVCDAVPVWSNLKHGFWLYLLGFFVIVFAQALLWRKAPYLRAGIVLWNGFLLPVAQIVPTLHARADRFLYLPLLGAMFLLVQILVKVIPNIKTQVLTFGLIALIFGAASWKRTAEFENDISLFTATLRVSPQCKEAHSYLGTSYLATQAYEKAITHFQEALRKDTAYRSYVFYPGTLNNYALSLLRSGRVDESVNVFLQAMESRPKSITPDWHFNLAIGLLQLNRAEEARSQLLIYLSTQPDTALAYYYLGRACILLELREDARSALSRYVELAPNAPDAATIRQLLEQL